MALKWYGWIMAREDCKKELEAMGIKLGPYDQKLEIFGRCELTAEAFVRLMAFRGRFLWKLSRKRSP